MKKQWSKIIAMSLVCAITLPTTVFGGTAPTLSGNTTNTVSSGIIVDGEGDVDRATYNVMIPLDMNFAIDTFEIAGKSQIYGVDYPVVNLSVFPVKVGVTVSANIPQGVSASFVTSPTDVKLSTGNEKAAYMTVYVPDSVDISAGQTDIAYTPGSVSGSYLPVSDNNVLVTTDTAPASFAFKLGSYVSGNDISQGNVAVFSFNGKVNPQVQWAKGDLKVKGAFTFEGLSRDTYAALESNSANNVVTGSGGSSSSKTVTYSKSGGRNAEFTIPMPAGATDIATVVFLATPEISMAKGPGWTYNTSTGKLALLATGGVLNASSATAPGTYSLRITFNNSPATVYTDYKLIVTN